MTVVQHVPFIDTRDEQGRRRTHVSGRSTVVTRVRGRRTAWHGMPRLRSSIARRTVSFYILLLIYVLTFNFVFFFFFGAIV